MNTNEHLDEPILTDGDTPTVEPAPSINNINTPTDCPAQDASMEETVEQETTEQEPVEQEPVEQKSVEQKSDAPAKKGLSPLAFLLEYLELFVTCLAVILVMFSFVCRICSVSGDSMLPTLKDGQLLLVSDLFYDPKPGDIIIFHQTSEEISRFNEPIIKRVIATSGQHVRIDFDKGTVEIDGVVIQEDYIQLIDTLGEEIGEYRVFAEHHMQMTSMPGNKTHRVFEATVPEGCLFVMGDNRNNSSDSRTNVIGFVDERRVLGHVICRLTPTDAFGPVD